MSQFSSIEGYGKNLEYDGPYLAGHDFDPKVVYAKSGDPEAQAERQAEFEEQLTANSALAEQTEEERLQERINTLEMQVAYLEKHPEAVPINAHAAVKAEAQHAMEERLKELDGAVAGANDTDDVRSESVSEAAFVTGSQTIDYTAKEPERAKNEPVKKPDVIEPEKKDEPVAVKTSSTAKKTPSKSSK